VNLPNLLTIARIFSVPLLVWLIASGQPLAAFWLFALAGITDGLDGYLARTRNQKTELGAYLDAVADKALLVSIYVTLGVFNEIPRLLAIAVVFRVIVIIGGLIVALLVARPLPIVPLNVSKLNTVAQIVFAGFILGSDGFGLRLPSVETIGAWAVGGLTLASAAAYLVAFIRHMALTEPAAPGDEERAP
jgi:cardiolipin synthase (CMP-forming)